MDMPKLFIANKNYSSWSLRPWVLMKALGLPFEEVVTPFGGNAAYRSFAEFSPSDKVPCLHDGKIVVWDSLAIVEYLAEKHAGVWPNSLEARTWARCACAEMHSGFSAVREVCSMSIGIRVQLNSWPDDVLADWARIAELWQEGLSRFGGPFLAGSAFTAVDAFFAPVCYRAQTYQPALPQPALDYVQRILDLPAMQQWYQDGLAESWREAKHEDSVAKVGKVMQDFRK